MVIIHQLYIFIASNETKYQLCFELKINYPTFLSHVLSKLKIPQSTFEMTVAIHCLSSATVYKCDPTKQLLTVSSSNFSADLFVPQTPALSQLSVLFLVTYSHQHFPSQNCIWYGFNFTGQTIVLMRSLRVLISGLPLMFLGILFLKVSSSSVPAPVGDLLTPSTSRAKSHLPKEPP